MYTVLYRADGLNAQRPAFQVSDQPVVVRWSGLDQPLELLTDVTFGSRCSSNAADLVPYYQGSCASLTPVVLEGSGTMVLVDPGWYALRPSGAQPTTGVVASDRVSFDQARLIVANEATAIACAASAPCPVVPTIGLVATWG